MFALPIQLRMLLTPFLSFAELSVSSKVNNVLKTPQVLPWLDLLWLDLLVLPLLLRLPLVLVVDELEWGELEEVEGEQWTSQSQIPRPLETPNRVFRHRVHALARYPLVPV